MTFTHLAVIECTTGFGHCWGNTFVDFSAGVTPQAIRELEKQKIEENKGVFTGAVLTNLIPLDPPNVGRADAVSSS